jgi:hypothetical protein
MDYLGTVKGIYRYPVKSIGGETSTSATLVRDRRQPPIPFLSCRQSIPFPMLTGREVADLGTYSARYLKPENPRYSAIRSALRARLRRG